MPADHTVPAHKRLGSRPGKRAVTEAYILITTILASAMVFIDGNVVTIALPEIQRDFDASLAGQQWVVEAYLLTLTALMLTGGALGDLKGRRQIFVIGVGRLRAGPDDRPVDRRPRLARHWRGPAGARQPGDHHIVF